MPKSLSQLAFATIAVLCAPAGAFAAPPPPHAINLGGVNLTYWCRTTFGQTYAAKLLGPTAGDWRCVIQRTGGRGGGYGGYAKSISVQDACRLQYGKSGLIAYALNWGDPLSWRCFEPRSGGRRP